MIHRPDTLFTYRLILELRRGKRGKPPMKLAAIANFLNMTEDAIKKMLQRVGKDRRGNKRPGSKDRRANVPRLSSSEIRKTA